MCNIKDPLKDPPTSPHVCAIDYGGARFYDTWRNIREILTKILQNIKQVLKHIKVIFQCFPGTLHSPHHMSTLLNNEVIWRVK